ncbi:hypothetical protein GIB67_028895 [Kingdonia uniflora]|uniref:Uncharacterized protein n=1 Tax=Kingdonia uniflora TaxID=39325 RepID=A0A7J7LTQ7_9MAGN|nr:hypothetical protein GIB67_028895 [Kingdonia uniflora]
MLGTGLQFRRGGNQGEDRFYNPVKARRNQCYYYEQNQIQKGRNDNGGIGVGDGSSATMVKGKIVIKGDGAEEEEMGSSNLDRFLESTTPSVPAQYLSTTRMRGSSTCDVEYQPYFILEDLWESYKEWSAYGAGVPLILNESDCVVQYYVPFLSGIQIYSECTVSPKSMRRFGEDSDGDSYRDTSSDGSSDCEVERTLKHSMDRLSVVDGPTSFQEGFSSDDGEARNAQGSLIFEYLERAPPYCREPLADKANLARRFPQLKTLRSCDLLPTSWISVAWYPIYRIPTGPTLKDLDACFLTFHSLSTPMRGAGTAQTSVVTYPTEPEGIPIMSLRVFALASYKFNESMWTPSGGRERQLSNSMLQAAVDWLRLVGVILPDFQFFASHGPLVR